jgi:hypothetical protein
VEYHASSSTERGNPMNKDTQTYNYIQLQKELMASIYQVAMTDNVLQDKTILLDVAGETYRVNEHLKKVKKLLNAISDARAFNTDGSQNLNLYQYYRG